MKREEAIHFATCLKNNWTINFADMEEFCDMAIEALQFAEHFDLLKEYQSLQEVVRCKDCKHWASAEDYDCEIHSGAFGADDFCSYGERKGGDDE